MRHQARRELTQVGTDPADTTCRSCRAQLGLDGDGSDLLRLEALFVLSLTLGMRPGELRGLRWDHVDLDEESSTFGAAHAVAAT